MNLLQALEKTPDSFTENGASTFSTTYNANLDFFSLASAKRDNVDEAVSLFTKAVIEDSNLAVKNLFFLRDIRQGNGERSVFLHCIEYLIFTYFNSLPEEIENLIRNIPEYGRWKDVFDLIGISKKSDLRILEIVKDRLREEQKLLRNNKKSHSLFAKWFPLVNNVKDERRKDAARKLCKYLFNGNERKCRKEIVKLRKNSVVEQNLSRNDLQSIEYSHVPSCAFLKYQKVFSRKDKERFRDFLSSVKRGIEKVNTSTLYPYEIMRRVMETDYTEHFTEQFTEEMEQLDILWNNLPEYTDSRNSLCVVDVSGSMFTKAGSVTPITVSVSLGLYCAEHNKGTFKNHFITFSDKPKLVRIEGKNIFDKYRFISNHDWGFTTDIQSVFDLILSSAKKYSIPQKEMPEIIYIISDMEFNHAVQGKTNFEVIKDKYDKAGYTLPTIVFWNVNSRKLNLPVTKDENNIILVSGFSPKIFEMVIQNVSPVQFMLSVLNSERYEKITLNV